MIGVVATIKVKPGVGPDYEAVFTELAERVRRDEPDNVVYELFRSRAEADTYKVLEIYRSEAALEAHRQSAHFQEIVPKMAPFRDGRPAVEYLDGID